MPKIPSLTSAKLIRILLQHGFVLDHQTGSHRVYYNLEKKRRVVVPYHRKELPRVTLIAILKEAGLHEYFE
ncbi:MAG: type II toxin-antitoxin system HicA family toxin [Nitrospirae bacterium]|nr:type II toxin-antitoxin system HicA family toxin [Nitrospirota bacterium]